MVSVLCCRLPLVHCAWQGQGPSQKLTLIPGNSAQNLIHSWIYSITLALTLLNVFGIRSVTWNISMVVTGVLVTLHPSLSGPEVPKGFWPDNLPLRSRNWQLHSKLHLDFSVFQNESGGCSEPEKSHKVGDWFLYTSGAGRRCPFWQFSGSGV